MSRLVRKKDLKRRAQKKKFKNGISGSSEDELKYTDLSKYADLEHEDDYNKFVAEYVKTDQMIEDLKNSGRWMEEQSRKFTSDLLSDGIKEVSKNIRKLYPLYDEGNCESLWEEPFEENQKYPEVMCKNCGYNVVIDKNKYCSISTRLRSIFCPTCGRPICKTDSTGKIFTIAGYPFH